MREVKADRTEDDAVSLCREALNAIADLRGRTPEHRTLYGRVLILLVAVIFADLIGSIIVCLVERQEDHPQIKSFGQAVVWSTSQLLSGGSSLAVTSTIGHVTEVVLELLAITVTAAFVGSLAAFFHRRDLERHPLRTPTQRARTSG